MHTAHQHRHGPGPPGPQWPSTSGARTLREVGGGRHTTLEPCSGSPFIAHPRPPRLQLVVPLQGNQHPTLSLPAPRPQDACSGDLHPGPGGGRRLPHVHGCDEGSRGRGCQRIGDPAAAAAAALAPGRRAHALHGALSSLAAGVAAAGCVEVPDFVQEESIPACQQCDPSGAKCAKCYAGSGVSAKTGACVKCTDENALDCDGDAPSKALDCAWWYGLSAKTGACVECTLKDADDTPTCQKCDG